MKTSTLSFLAAIIALSPLPALAQEAQPSSQKNTNEAVAVVTGKSIHQNTDKFDFDEYAVSATAEAQASDLRFRVLAPAVRDVATDRATALDRGHHDREKVLYIAGYFGNGKGGGR
jgi:hypothetical protein